MYNKYLLTLVLFILLPTTIFAWDAKIGDIYYNLNGNNASVTYGHVYNNVDLYKGNISIPSTVSYKGVVYTVTSIYMEAFKGCKYLKEISIPNTVNSIGWDAFGGCSALETVKVEDGETKLSVANSARGSIFKDCIGLKKVYLGRYITYKDSNRPFCKTNIEEIEIGKYITTIEKESFMSCYDLKSVIFQGKVSYIGESAFSGCSSLLSINIPSTVTTIGESAFASCGFSSINLPEKLTYLGNAAFENCKNLKEIHLPRTLRTLSESLFSGCSSLSEVWFATPISVTSIDRYCFMDCKKLSRMFIPSSVKSIKAGAFRGCSSLNEIEIEDLSKWTQIDFTDIDNGYYSNPLYYGHYLYLNGKRIDDLEIPSSIPKLNDYVFQGCYLNSLYIQNSVKEISETAFHNSAIKEIILNCANTQAWFKGNVTVETVKFGDSAMAIEENAFSGCTGLMSVYFSKSIKSIGCWAFNRCTNLKAVYVDDLASWCNVNINHFLNKDNHTNPLYYAHNLYVKNSDESVIDLVIPDGVTKIANDVFAGCNMRSITIPSSVKTIGGQYTFNGCANLNAVYISDLAAWCNINFTESNPANGHGNPLGVAHNLYLNKKLLTDIEIPNNVSFIRDWSFHGATCLRSVIVPNEVSSIGYKAFDGCSELELLVIPACNVSSVALTGCDKLNKVVSFSTNVLQIPSTCTILVPSSMKNKYTTGIVCAIVDDNETQSTITLKSTEHFTLEKAKLELYNANNVAIRTDERIVYEDVVKFTEVAPNKEHKITIFGTAFGKDISGEITLKTTPLTLNIEQVNATNLTMKLKGTVSGDATITKHDFGEYGNGDEVVVTGLYPGQNVKVTYNVTTSDGSTSSVSKWFKTIDVSASATSYVSSSSCILKGHYSVIDATVSGYGFTNTPDQMQIKLDGLDPNTKYSNRFYVETNEGGRRYSDISFTTKALMLITLQPKVIASGDVIVAAKSNLDDEETNVGFEWRRNDWTNDFQSNQGTAYLYEGQMEGYIRNLNTEKLWKFRPYYESKSGKRYYGEWVGLDPTNTSYFEPTVHTYARIDVQGNTAQVRGYAMRGSDNITRQGFKYWQSVAGSRSQASSVQIPAGAITVSASGNVMETTLTGLDYETTYSYVAFVTTAEGETYYGDERQFITGADPTVVDEVMMNGVAAAKLVGYYDLSGHRIDSPQKGQLVIARMSDGTARKLVVQ